MKQVCKICNVEKIKAKIGKRKTGSIFVDDKGKEWNGRICNSCHVEKTGENMKKLRALSND